MCRNIKPLFNLIPVVNEEEIQLAALQYVRKISGSRKPSKTNQAAFNTAVSAVAAATATLLNQLESKAPPKERPSKTNPPAPTYGA